MSAGPRRLAAPATDLHWLVLEIEALYVSDSRGRLIRTREPDARPAPAFALSRSAHGNLWRFADRLPRTLVRELARLASREAPFARAEALAEARGPAPPERWEAMRRRLSDEGIAWEPEWRGPCFRFPPSFDLAAHECDACVELDESNAPSLCRGPYAWLASEWQGCAPVVARLDSGIAVSMAWSARGGGERPTRAVEAGIETRESHRGSGHARSAVAHWASLVSARGALPLYSTTWSNRASRAVARSLGLEVYGEHGHLG